MKKPILYLIVVCCFLLGWGNCDSLSAQSKSITINGTVLDAQGQPLVGVNVIVKDQPGLGTNTNIDGQYKIKTGAHGVLSFSYLGYASQEIPINSRTAIDVKLIEDTNSVEEVVIIGAGVQRKASVVGAVSSINMEDLKTPTANITNSLAGNVPGIIAVQRSGEPGKDISEFWIRGISTFGANASALVLVDGIERNFNEINVEDIESFSVLKDASATAIYGQRGANGVLLITTKRGKEGKVNINFKAEYGISASAMEREFVNAETYASMANEARQSRYQDPVYDQSDLEIIQYKLDPDLYPNVDWQDELLKKSTSTFKTSLNISGGGATARYYISGSYYKQGGIYNDNTENDYGTSTNYKRYNFRINTDINITKTTILEAGLGGWIVDQHKPGMTTDDFWKSISYMTPITVPLRYSNGQLPTYGTSGFGVSPYVLLNHTGYQTFWENKVESNIGIKQDLSFITKGLRFMGRISYDAYNKHNIARLKTPALYKAERVRDMEGNLITSRIRDEQPLHQESEVYGSRRTYGELQLTYERAFGKHRIGGLLFYYMQSFSENDVGHDIFKSVPQRNMALSGRATYGYDDRYLVEFNFGYSGSENFESKERFGFFPAIAAGWVVSNEKFVKKHLPWLNLLKIRYSYGQVGNDRIGGGTRFPYITTVAGGGGINFGNMGATYGGGLRIQLMGAEHLTWEVATKHNIGVDLRIADRFDLTVDAFRDTREDIFMRRGFLPGSAGLLFINGQVDQRPWGNVGSMRSEGIDGNFSYTHKFNKSLMCTLRGNFTYAYTEVLKYDEAANALSYRMNQGYKFEQNRGLLALGLFKDDADIANSPSQYGQELMPGDIKYKDVNGDGIVNDDDIVPIGNTTKPELVYGFGLSAQWKNFDFSILFQGTGKTDFVMEGYSVFPFIAGEVGNILSAVSDPNNRWISREISGDPATERTDATFPRLAYGSRENNYKWSTWWLRDGHFLRLKNLEVGYTLPKTFTRKFKVEKARVYFLGYNLACWSPFDWWDPETASKDGSAYPIQKTFTFGVNVNF
ncbi:MAG: TonB-dependent receptor [Alistipes sp.]